ncbi:MAG: glycosyltransferase family 39 protein [Planctomycetota bacterium]
MSSASPPPAATRPSGLAARIAAHLSALVVLGLAVALGWDRGPDALIDFGRELYVPWRLVEGDALHREIGWFNGPLGPWAIEGWMRVFGVSLDALQALNAVVIGLTALVLARLVERASGGYAAWVGVLVFATVFAVAQQEASGNFLFLAPYSHGITFGFLASVACLLGVVRGIELRSVPTFGLAGVAAGLAFLTKAEVFLGLGAAVGALAVVALVRPPKGARRLRWTGAFGVGFALPLALAYARFAAQLGGGAPALEALAGTWVHAVNADVSGLPFYRMMRGTYDLPATLQRLALASVLVPLHVFAVTRLGALLSERAGRGERAGFVLGLGLGGVLTVAVCVVAPIKWMLLPLVWFLPAATLYAFARSVRGATAYALLALAAFGFGLQPKVLLVPLARQYGFVLSVPGALLLAAFVVAHLPRRHRGTADARAGLAGAGLGIVAVFGLMNANATRNWYATKTGTFATGADRIHVGHWRGDVLEAVRVDLAERLPEDATLLVLPEGVTLNYALRKRTPSRLVNYMVPELVMFDERDVVADLNAEPPDAVVLVHRPTDIYGYPFFGQGYGEAILDWVQERYAFERGWGDAPFEAAGKDAFGAQIWLPKER